MNKLLQQCWLDESDARLTSYRLKKSLHNLLESYNLENMKKDNKFDDHKDHMTIT